MTATKKIATRQERAGYLRTKLASVLSFARLAMQIAPKKGKSAPQNEPAKVRQQPAAKATEPCRKPSSQSGPSRAVESAAEAAARLRERERCAAILMSPAGQCNFELAKVLAFETRMARTEALAVLESTPAPAPRGSFAHTDRAARNPKIGASLHSVPKEQATAGRWDRALAQANRSTRQASEAPVNRHTPERTAA